MKLCLGWGGQGTDAGRQEGELPGSWTGGFIGIFGHFHLAGEGIECLPNAPPVPFWAQFLSWGPCIALPRGILDGPTRRAKGTWGDPIAGDLLTLGALVTRQASWLVLMLGQGGVR